MRRGGLFGDVFRTAAALGPWTAWGTSGSVSGGCFQRDVHCFQFARLAGAVLEISGLAWRRVKVDSQRHFPAIRGDSASPLSAVSGAARANIGIR